MYTHPINHHQSQSALFKKSSYRGSAKKKVNIPRSHAKIQTANPQLPSRN